MISHKPQGNVAVLDSPARIAWDLRTPDLALIRRSIAACLKPFSIEATSDGAYDARVCHRKLHRTELTLIDYGDSIKLDAGRMKSFHLAHIPLRGSYWFEANGERQRVGVGQVHIIHPDLHLRMDWSSTCQLLVLRTTDPRLREREALLKTSARSLEHGRIFSCMHGPGASLGRTLEFLAGELMQGGLLRTGTRAAETADALLIDALVYAMSNSAPAPTSEQHAYLARAKHYILQNLKADLSSAAIASAAGVSLRSLFRAYRTLHGTAPMAWVRQQRLQCVRDELQRTDLIHATISNLASDWGFNHFGHFCEAYRRFYGETPTDTRRKAIETRAKQHPATALAPRRLPVAPP